MNINEQPILAKKIGEELVFDSRGGDKYIYVSLMEGGAYVLPKEIIYTKNDGRFAAKYSVVQDAGINLTGSMDINQAMAQLEKRYSIDDDVLRQKFIEYGLRIKYVDETARSTTITLDNDKEIVIRESNKYPIDKAFQASADTDMLIIKYGDDYYFALSNMMTSGSKKGQFYFNKAYGQRIGPNAFYFLEGMRNKEKFDELYQMLNEQVVGQRAKKRKTKKRQEVQKQETETTSTQVRDEDKSTVRNMMEEIITNPQFSGKGVKRMTCAVTDDLDVTINLTNNNVEIEREGKLELTYEELNQVKEVVDSVLGYASAA